MRGLNEKSHAGFLCYAGESKPCLKAIEVLQPNFIRTHLMIVELISPLYRWMKKSGWKSYYRLAKNKDEAARKTHH